MHSVLVVGAGPTGLPLAGDLARYGVPCRVIDEAGARPGTSRAITLHARTLEVFDDLGIAGAVLALGRRTHAINLYAPDGPAGTGTRRIASLAFDELRLALPLPLEPAPGGHRGRPGKLRGAVRCERGAAGAVRRARAGR